MGFLEILVFIDKALLLRERSGLYHARVLAATPRTLPLQVLRNPAISKMVTNYLRDVHVLRGSSSTSILHTLPLCRSSFLLCSAIQYSIFILLSFTHTPDIQLPSIQSLLSSKPFWISHLLSIRLLLISSRLLRDITLYFIAPYYNKA